MKYIAIFTLMLSTLLSARGEEPAHGKVQQEEQEKKLKELKEMLDKQYGEQIRVSKIRHATLNSVDRAKIPYLGDFIKLYPDAIITYTSFAGADFPSFDVTATIYDRYQLSLRLPVIYTKDHKGVAKYGEPTFYFLEISEVSYIDEQLETLYGDLQFNFGQKQWEILFDSKGDYSVLGYNLKKKDPVKDFDLLRKNLKLNERPKKKK